MIYEAQKANSAIYRLVTIAVHKIHRLRPTRIYFFKYADTLISLNISNCNVVQLTKY